jgi:hypothetical protein
MALEIRSILTSTLMWLALAIPQTATAAIGTEFAEAIVSPDLGYTLEGTIEFNADFASNFSASAQMPVGRSPMPYLHVCAWRQVGERIDFEFTEYPREDGDDQLLGCDRTNSSGRYEILVEETATLLQSEIYLSTKLCDDVMRGARSDADVCVRINRGAASDSRPENVKAIWSRVETLGHWPRVDRHLKSWNLSCPNEKGLGFDFVSCPASELEPDAWSAYCPCTSFADEDTCPVVCTSANCGDTNSRTGCNKEAVHVFRAAIEPYKTWGSNKPTSRNTYGKSRSGFSSDHCEEDECQDEINLHMARIQPSSEDDETCVPTATSNGASDFDDICIVTPLNPFRVVHEIGHVIDMRWRWDGAGHGCKGEGFDHEVCERTAMREGFANFTAVAAWFNADASDPQFCHDNSSCKAVEPASALSSCGSVPSSEGRATQFFWDLRDSRNDAGRESDSQRWTYQKIRNVLSAFPYGTGDMESREGRVDADGDGEWDSGYASGANGWDFTYHWDRKRGATDGYCEVMQLNCIDCHERCDDCDDLCR